MLPAAAPTHLRDTDLIIVRGIPDKVSLRSSAGTPRAPRSTSPVPPPQRSVSRLEGGLSAAALVLVLQLVWLLWQWQQTSAAALSARDDAALSWNFADAVLAELADKRMENEALDASRHDLIHALHQFQENGESLKKLLNEWKRAHHELASVSQQSIEQWTSYSQALEHHLGSARVALSDTNTHLERERVTAQTQLAQLGTDKATVEREAEAYARKAQNLEREASNLDQRARNLHNDKVQLESDAIRLRSCISELERRNACLSNENAMLASRNSQLCSEVRELQHRTHCLEAKLNGKE